MTTTPARRMSQRRTTLLDSALIIVGAGLSTLIVSTDGNGQNPMQGIDETAPRHFNRNELPVD